MDESILVAELPPAPPPLPKVLPPPLPHIDRIALPRSAEVPLSSPLETRMAELLKDENMSLLKIQRVLEFFLNEKRPLILQIERGNFIISLNEIQTTLQKLEQINKNIRSDTVTELLTEIPNTILRTKIAHAIWLAFANEREIRKKLSNSHEYDSCIRLLSELQLQNEKLTWHIQGQEQQIDTRTLFLQIDLFQKELMKDLQQGTQFDPTHFFPGMGDGPFDIYRKLRSEAQFLKEKFHSIQEFIQKKPDFYSSTVENAYAFIGTIEDNLKALHNHEFAFVEYNEKLHYSKICDPRDLLEDIHRLKEKVQKLEKWANPGDASISTLFSKMNTDSPLFLDLRDALEHAFTFILERKKEAYLNTILPPPNPELAQMIDQPKSTEPDQSQVPPYQRISSLLRPVLLG